jgi:hypothetical protein
MLPKKREEVLQSQDVTISPELRMRLSIIGKGDLRKTVRKHLVRMCAYGYARLINGRYYPRESPASKELIEMVSETISTVAPQDWSFPLAEDVAIYRTYVNPPAPDPHRFDAFFADAESEFKNGLFSFESLLVDAIGTGHLSGKFYDAARNSLNMKLLRDGWNKHFNPTKVLIWTFVINPSKFLELIQTPKGQQWTKEMLAANWERILAGGKKRLAETRAMDRKMKKFQLLREKQEEENTKRLRSKAS